MAPHLFWNGRDAQYLLQVFDAQKPQKGKNIYAQVRIRWVRFPEHKWVRFCERPGFYDRYGKKPAFIRVGPWFQGPAEIKARGIWFDSRSFLALQIVGASDPGGARIQRDRENTNKTNEPADPEDEGKAWPGTPERRLVKPPAIINLTEDDEPDQGGSPVEVQDDDFEILGDKREVIDVRRDKAQTSAGRKIKGGDAGAYASGDPHGTGKGTGHVLFRAETILESMGVLWDMWRAFLHLRDAQPDLIQDVEWFSFRHGWNRETTPQMIALAPLPREPEVDIKTRDWLYFDPKSKAETRGILVARVLVKGRYIHFIEIQRRPRRIRDAEGHKKDGEEAFRGLAFTLNHLGDLDPWLRHLLSGIRYVKGVMQKLTADCPGTAVTFNHSPANTEEVPCEAAVMNALRKLVDIRVSKRDTDGRHESAREYRKERSAPL